MLFLRRLFIAVLILGLIPSWAMALDTRLALDGFYEAAFRGEYGDTQRGVTVRWQAPIIMYMKGSCTDEDILTLAKLMYDLAAQVKGLPELSLTTKAESANVVLTFVPQAEMKEAVSDYKAGNVGFVMVKYDKYVIKSAQIAISADVSQQTRNAVIREEVVNMLGLLNDITVTTQSIICQSGKTVTNLSEIDYAMLNYLYSKEMKPGTTLDKAKKILGD